MSNNKIFHQLSTYEYKQRFGIGSGKKHNKERIHEAYKKAWECRDFEINKFWNRAAYFWGFIAAIFAGYIAVVTGSSDSDGKQSVDTPLGLIFLMLGLVFSVAWLLVIKGSKRWQENWEAHIDLLEDEITGPLYKTVYTKRNEPYYSVSKISECVAWVVIGAWGILLLHYFITILKRHGISIAALLKIDTIVPIVIVIGGFIGIFLLFTNCKSAGNGYKTEILDGKDHGFIDRKEKRNG